MQKQSSNFQLNCISVKCNDAITLASYSAMEDNMNKETFDSICSDIETSYADSVTLLVGGF